MKSIYSLWRQTDDHDDIVQETALPVGDLIGIYFPELAMLGNACVEVIEPEWVEDYYISSTSGGTTAKTGYHYAFVDVSSYDYVIIPIYKAEVTGMYTGLCHGPGTTIQPRVAITMASGYTDPACAYCSFKVDVDNDLDYAAITCKNTAYTPVLGIRFNPT